MSQTAKMPKTEKAAPSAQVFPFPTFDISKFDLAKFDLSKFDLSKFDLSKFDLTKFEMPKFDAAAFDFSKVEVPAPLREAADQAVAQLKDGYAKMKASTEETIDLLEDTYATASAGTKDFHLKALEAARINMNAGFDHARDLMGAKSLAELIELQSAYARKAFETLQGQVKDLGAVAQKTAADTVEPVKEKVGKAMKTSIG